MTIPHQPFGQKTKRILVLSTLFARLGILWLLAFTKNKNHNKRIPILWCFWCSKACGQNAEERSGRWFPEMFRTSPNKACRRSKKIYINQRKQILKIFLFGFVRLASVSIRTIKETFAELNRTEGTGDCQLKGDYQLCYSIQQGSSAFANINAGGIKFNSNQHWTLSRKVT